jgi:hypothetical protein
MSWQNLETLLNQLFTELNQQNSVSSPRQIWENYQSQIQDLLAENPQEFVQLAPNLWLPKSIEIGRILAKLRQRFTANKEGRNLTGRIRTEVLLRQRPIRNIQINSLTGEIREVGDIASKLDIKPIHNFSEFQIAGFTKILQAIRNQEGLVMVAPTGAGKTEVFLLPLIYEIARKIQINPQQTPKFILLYPRVALLKDQLSRIFRYVYQANQNQLTSGQGELFHTAKKVNNGIIIGFQFSGVASEAKETLNNTQLFKDKKFLLLENECCPICQQGSLIYQKKRNSVSTLECDNNNCGAVFNVSLAKNDHATYKPHILVTTAESLDRIYLNPKPEFEKYLSEITGVLFDEVHLYHSLYGSHIHHLIQRLENISKHTLVKIASSATISNPERFASKFFYGDEHHHIILHDANNYPSEASGLEVLYFLQSPEEERRVGAAPTLIQSTMALGHGLFLDRPDNKGDRAIIFTESLDLANRFYSQIKDAENTKKLWTFRTILDDLIFQEQTCPHTDPANCLSHYLEGECWRGILGGVNCTDDITGIRERPLDISYVSSQQKTSYLEGDIVVATPSLDVGIDDDRIMATIHYRPPRNVFDFIQRRGRAGRSADTIAYTLLIVANSPSDQFYFFRRHRLVYGNYELPLNPQNPVLKAMHERIAYERERMSFYVHKENGKVQKAILNWIWEKLEECSLIKTHFGDWLEDNKNLANRDKQKELRKWIKEQKERFEAYLNLRWTLQDIENEAPDLLTEDIEEAFALIKQYLDGNSNLITEIGTKLKYIYQEFGSLIFDEQDTKYQEELKKIQTDITNTWIQLQQKVEFGICFEQADGLYNFFHTLERFSEPDKRLWILNSAPDVIKIVLQALFYLRNSHVDFFIPDAYFNEVKPIIVGLRRERSKRITLKQEDTTKLSTLLIPYRTAYRYDTAPFLNVVETEHNPNWVNAKWGEGGIVNVRLLGEGIHNDSPSEFRPEKIYVKAVKGDKQGQQVVKMCPECFAIYSENRSRKCHNQKLKPVRLYSEAIVERQYHYQPENLNQISATLQLISELDSEITVHGSTARVVNHFWDQNTREYLPMKGNNTWTFEAHYVNSKQQSEPVRYGLKTVGISWNLQTIVANLLQDTTLKNQIEQIEIEGNYKEFNSRLILHTASHILQKTIASISGVNEETLEYCFKEDIGEVVVWERYEGGSGISQVFVETAKNNPLEVYREMLASVLCPVNLSERKDWSTPEELKHQLLETWHLDDTESINFIETIVNEANAERQVTKQTQNDDESVENSLQCQKLDGCPACLHTNNCTDRFEQAQAVSHLVAFALIQALGKNW